MSTAGDERMNLTGNGGIFLSSRLPEGTEGKWEN